MCVSSYLDGLILVHPEQQQVTQHFQVSFTSAEEETEQHDGVLKRASKRQRFVAVSHLIWRLLLFLAISQKYPSFHICPHIRYVFVCGYRHRCSGAEGLQRFKSRDL